MTRLLAHGVGDYILQTNWMAQAKLSRHLPAAAHAATYTACFVPITRNWRALAIIGGTHFVIDRWRLAKHVVWLKEQLNPVELRPGHTPTGYGDYVPDYLSTWLLILCDNIIHLAINEAALRRFP
jgi:hypothetical protein